MARIRIKIINKTLRNTQTTYPIWRTLEVHDITAWEIKRTDEGKIFYVTLDTENLEKVLAQKQTIENYGMFDEYEIKQPLNYNAMCTVVVRKLDPIHIGKDPQELKQSIEQQNETLKIDQIIKLPNNDHILKIKFATPLMAGSCLEEGILIDNQYITPQYIQEEVHVNLKPCYRCYKYNHDTNNCKRNINFKICSECGQEGHTYKDCSNINKKCINCGKDHRTLASICEIRKKIIKEKSRSLRKAQQKSSFRDKKQHSHQKMKTNNQLRGNETTQVRTTRPMNNFMAKLIINLTFAFITERQHKGTFQSTMNDMNRLNNMPQTIYPDNIDTTNFEDIMGTLGDITTTLTNSTTQDNAQNITTTSAEPMQTQQSPDMYCGQCRSTDQKTIEQDDIHSILEHEVQFESTTNMDTTQSHKELASFDTSLLKERAPSPAIQVSVEEVFEYSEEESDGDIEQREIEAKWEYEEYLKTLSCEEYEEEWRKRNSSTKTTEQEGAISKTTEQEGAISKTTYKRQHTTKKPTRYNITTEEAHICLLKIKDQPFPINMSNEQIRKQLKKSTWLKYTYRNRSLNRKDVAKSLYGGKMKLAHLPIYEVKENFYRELQYGGEYEGAPPSLTDEQMWGKPIHIPRLNEGQIAHAPKILKNQWV